MSTLFNKRVSGNAVCPRCGRAAKTFMHFGWLCPLSKEVWGLLGFHRMISSVAPGFSISALVLSDGWYVVRCGHYGSKETKGFTSQSHRDKEISDFVSHFLLELDAIEEQKLTRAIWLGRWELPQDDWVKINFDAAFSKNSSRSGSGVVIMDRIVDR